MTDLPTEHALPLPTAANRIARCKFCFTLNEYIEGEPAPLCTNCSLDLSVLAHLRPLDVGVLLAQLAQEPGTASPAVPAPEAVPHEPPSMLDHILAADEDNSLDTSQDMSPPKDSLIVQAPESWFDVEKSDHFSRWLILCCRIFL